MVEVVYCHSLTYILWVSFHETFTINYDSADVFIFSTFIFLHNLCSMKLIYLINSHSLLLNLFWLHENYTNYQFLCLFFEDFSIVWESVNHTEHRWWSCTAHHYGIYRKRQHCQHWHRIWLHWIATVLLHGVRLATVLVYRRSTTLLLNFYTELFRWIFIFCTFLL